MNSTPTPTAPEVFYDVFYKGERIAQLVAKDDRIKAVSSGPDFSIHGVSIAAF